MNRTLALVAFAFAFATVGCSSRAVSTVDAGPSPADLGSGADPMQQLAADTGFAWTVRWHADVHTPALLEGRTAPLAATADDAARVGRDFIRAHAALFAMGARDTLDTIGSEVDELGMTHARFQEAVGGHPVWGGELIVHFAPDGALIRINGRYLPILSPLGDAVRSADEARVLAVAAARRHNPDWSPDSFTTHEPKLYVLPLDAHAAKLAWRVQIDIADPVAWASFESFLDAQDGTLLHAADVTNRLDGSGNGIFGEPEPLVVAANGASFILEDEGRGSPASRTYSAGGKTKLPGLAVRSKDPAHWDEALPAPGAAVDAHAFVAATWDYFARTHGRSGFDGKNKGVHTVVHYGQAWSGAFFDGDELVFGDGDGQTWWSPAGALDLVAHEYTHGVIAHSARLGSEGQNGALAEAIADIFGSFVANRWQLGATVYHPHGHPQPLRDLADPHASGNPATLAEWIVSGDDNGGVHVNSTIVSHAAWRMAQTLPRFTLDQIWYRALTRYLYSSADFAAAADATMAAARDLGGHADDVVRQAWVSAGVVQ